MSAEVLREAAALMRDRPEDVARRHFLADAGEHPLTVLHDDGLYRHLMFRKPDSLDRFEVITWPGHLTINGGHGTWTFARTEDMFEFFRSSRGLTRINPGYWGEKLRGGLACGNTLAEEYDSDLFHEAVKEYLDDFIDSCGWHKDVIADLRQEVAEHVTDDYCDWGHEAGAQELLSQFRFRTATRSFEFHDTWEWSLTRPSTHFLWSCWAIAHAVAEYDRRHTTQPGQPS